MIRPLALSALLLAVAAQSAAAALPAPFTTLASRPPGFAAPPSGSENDSLVHAVSSDGRLVLFQSCADGVFDGDDDRQCGLYRRDVVAGATILVAQMADTDGAGADMDGAGNVVAFETDAALVGADTNGEDDVYRWQNGIEGYELVSRTSGGAAGSDDSYAPHVSADGTAVGFSSYANDLLPGAPAGSSAYVRRSGVLSLVSRMDGAGGAPTANGGWLTSLSADGSAAAFVTSTAVVGDDVNTTEDVYVRVGNATKLASGKEGAGGDTGAGYSDRGLISGDGAFVVFQTSNQIVAGVPAGTSRVYRRQLSTGLVNLVSRATDGSTQPGDSRPVGISGDGARVAFTSLGKLDPADLPHLGEQAYDLYVRDVPAATTELASRAPGIAPSDVDDAFHGVLSGDGSTAVFAARPYGLADGPDPDFDQVFAKRLPGGELVHVDHPAAGHPVRGEMDRVGGFARGGLSADGTRLAFVHGGNAISDQDDDAGEQAFVRVLATGENILVSRANGVSGAPVPAGGEISDVVLSADGTKAAFSLQHAAFDAADTDPDYSVYVRDLVAGTTTYAGQGNPEAQCYVEGLDADGSKVSMRCFGKDLLGPENNATDIFVRDLAAGTTVRASRADGAAGAPGNDDSNGGGTFSADGRYVTFASVATNLEAGGPGVYVRDLVDERTVLVSRGDGAAGAKVADAGSDAGMSADGRRVAFRTGAAVTAADTTAAEDVYVRDWVAGTTTLATPRAGLPAGPDNDVRGAMLSRDGQALGFGIRESGEQLRIYVRDLASGTVELVSRATGVDGAIADESSDGAVIALDGTGACAAFVSSARTIDPFAARTDFLEQVYVRGACGLQAPSAPAPAPKAPDGVSAPRTGAVADRVAPVVGSVKLTRTAFAVDAKPTALAAAGKKQRRATPKGTTLSFRLSETATVGIAVERRTRGRRSGRSCAKSTPRLVRKKAKLCWRHTVTGTLTRSKLQAGTSKVAFTGRLGRRALAPGAYRFVLVARDAAGNRSKPATVAFTVKRR